MNKDNLKNIINFKDYPLDEANWLKKIQNQFDETGIVSLENFVLPESMDNIKKESLSKLNHAYFNPQEHNVYLKSKDKMYPSEHPRNKKVKSSKGCITDDLINSLSPLKIIYNSSKFIDFISFVTKQDSIHPYKDKLSSINIHYARRGEELGWHFDNSTFAITLMINEVSRGGEFEYTEPLRGSSINQTKEFENVSNVLNGKTEIKKISMKSGGLLLFNGKNSMHRVTKVHCNEIRILAVLAYNDKPGVSLSKSAQMTFYGRTDG